MKNQMMTTATVVAQVAGEDTAAMIASLGASIDATELRRQGEPSVLPTPTHTELRWPVEYGPVGSPSRRRFDRMAKAIGAKVGGTVEIFGIKSIAVSRVELEAKMNDPALPLDERRRYEIVLRRMSA